LGVLPSETGHLRLLQGGDLLVYVERHALHPLAISRALTSQHMGARGRGHPKGYLARFRRTAGERGCGGIRGNLA
jgi:hypothetical protein